MFPKSATLVVWSVLLAVGRSPAFAAEAMPEFCKEVLILHHSHFDVGFTHPQPAVWELHRDFIDQAIGMLESTTDWPELSQPRWTCEVTEPLMRWLSTAGPKDVQRFERLLRQGRIGISGMQYNTTPLCSAEELVRQMASIGTLRKRFGANIVSAHSHDVTGLPWTIVDLLLDADVELLVMGINLHLSGTPMPRPAAYRWRGPSGREILVMNGEHYSMFDQWTEPEKDNLDHVRAGLAKYLRHLEALHYPYDFVYLSATCAPYAYDNSPPNLELPRLVRQWNDRGWRPTLRFITPAELLERIKKIPRERLPVVNGDWTDYWNFGAGSSAVETRLTRNAKADLAAAELLQAFRPPDARLRAAVHQVWNDVALYDEHTWGAAGSLDQDAPMTAMQWLLKAEPAHHSRPSAAYLLARQLDLLAGNAPISRLQQGVLVVNPASVPFRGSVAVPAHWRGPGKRIVTQRTEPWPATRPSQPAEWCGPIEVPALGWAMIPFDQLKPTAALLQTGKDFIETPTHRLTFDPQSGRVTGLLDKQRAWQIVDAASPWGFFQLVHEKPDPKVDGDRKAFHVRSVVNERYGKTGWKTDWAALRTGAGGKTSCRVERSPIAATLVTRAEIEGVTGLEQRITLRVDSPVIELQATMLKQDVRTPEALYFAFPLNLPAQWQCHFDTASVPTELDAQQIPGTCRDWVTVDSYVSVHHGERGATLYCPDAPLVQVGGFYFGRKQDRIERRPNPLLLAWPLNNYWETNFRAAQPGRIELCYGFATHGAYSPATAARQASEVVQPPRLYPAFDCPALRSGCFLKLRCNAVVPVYVKPAEDGAGVIVRLLNVGSQAVDAEVELPARTFSRAWRCGTLEDNREALPVSGSGFAARLRLPPGQLTTVRIE
jgi:hypothetical protein